MGGKDDGVHIIDLQDSSKNQLIEKDLKGPTSWSSDGKYLLLGSPLGKMDLVPLTGDQKPIPVASQNGISNRGRISPDGKFIAFDSDESGRSEVYVQPMPPGAGRTEKVSISGGISPRWRRDSKELFFVSSDGSIMAVDFKAGPSVSVGVPHALMQVKGANPGDVQNYNVRGYGKQFLIFLAQSNAEDFPITVVLNWWAELRQQP